MASYDQNNPSKREIEKHDLVYDAWHNRYVKRDGSDTPNQNFDVNHYQSRDGMSHEFTRGRPKTPEAHERLSAEKIAYDSVFDSGYAENKQRKTKQSFMERMIFGRDS